MLYPLIVYKWEMLLPYNVVEDVIPHNSMLQHIVLADVISKWQSYIDTNVTGWNVMRNTLESSRTFGERFKEHLKAPSPIYDHFNITGHNIFLENVSIVGREDQNLSRWTKEALFIRVNNPSLNKNIGKYHLPHIWDEVLLNNSEPKLK